MSPPCGRVRCQQVPGWGLKAFFLAGNWQFVSVSQDFAQGEREAGMQNVRWEVQERLGLCHCLSLWPWAPHLPQLTASIKKQWL